MLVSSVYMLVVIILKLWHVLNTCSSAASTGVLSTWVGWTTPVTLTWLSSFRLFSLTSWWVSLVCSLSTLNPNMNLLLTHFPHFLPPLTLTHSRLVHSLLHCFWSRLPFPIASFPFPSSEVPSALLVVFLRACPRTFQTLRSAQWSPAVDSMLAQSGGILCLLDICELLLSLVVLLYSTNSFLKFIFKLS